MKEAYMSRVDANYLTDVAISIPRFLDMEGVLTKHASFGIWYKLK